MPHGAVLIVEDDYEIRITLRAILEEVGYAVETAANGREALALLQKESIAPGLILLDLMMPIMNGWEFADLLKSSAALAAIPFVVQSAFCDTRPPSGAVAVLSKPIDLDALLTLVDRHCG
jgi:CheY-like chemotaxis protein